MANPIDQRIEERQRRLNELRVATESARTLIVSLERDAAEVEIELRAYKDARSLFDTSEAIEESDPILAEVQGGSESGTHSVDGSFRMAESTRATFAFALERYPEPTTNKEFLDHLTEQGYAVDRNHLRSALWTHASRGLLEKVGTGLYKITALGASRIGEQLPA